MNGLSGAESISAGAAHTCAMTTAGPYCWGYSSSGEVRDGGIASWPVVSLDYLPDTVVSVVAGPMMTCAIFDDDTAQCWGQNYEGLLGTGSTADASTTPTPLVTGSIGVASLGLGYPVSCLAATSTGAMCWGNRSTSQGALGDGSTMNHSIVPVAPLGL